MQISRSICFNICNSTGINLQRGQQPRLMSRIEQVANILEKRISSLNAAPSQRRDEIAGEGTSQRLLKSASLDSMMGLRSPGTATPELREDWQPPEIVADISLDPDSGEYREQSAGMAASPFAEAAQQPLEETVIVTPGRVFHGLTRPPPQSRSKFHGAAPDRPDPVVRWKEQRTLLIFWLAAAIVTFFSSLWWLQIGMWAGVIGIIGPSLTICGCCSSRKLPLNVHVTRIFAVACSFLSVFTALLFTFLLFRLHCPSSVRASGKCSLFRLGMAVTALWHIFFAAVAGIVSIKASHVIALIEPAGLRRVVVLRPLAVGQGSRSRSLHNALDPSQDRHSF